MCQVIVPGAACQTDIAHQLLRYKAKMEANLENISEPSASGLLVDWSSAFQSREFRSDLAEVVVKTVAQLKDSRSPQQVAENARTLEAMGNATLGTGDVSQSFPVSNNAQGTSIVAPSFIRAVGDSCGTTVGQRQAGPSDNSINFESLAPADTLKSGGY